MRFYKDIIADVDGLKEDSKSSYHEWSPQSIKSYWNVCTNNPIVRAQFYPKDYWDDLLDWAAKRISIRPSTIVDVGCGNGNLIDCIAKTYRDTSIYGVDLSEDSFEPAKERFIKYKTVRFKVGSLDRLPFEDHSIDLVSPPGMVETPRLPGEEKVVVMWSRAAVSIRSAHEGGPEGSLGVDTQISEESASRRGSCWCARPDSANCHGARVDDFVR